MYVLFQTLLNAGLPGGILPRFDSEHNYVDVFNDLGQGIVTIPTVQNVLFLGAGVIMGMVVGNMPGLGPSAGLAILLPITFSLDPTGPS